MPDYAALKNKVNEMTERTWDEAGIKARIDKMSAEGIPRKVLDPKEMLAKKEQILDHVQLLAEEYNYMFKNCAQGTALALMEEFGQGSMEIVRALAMFPGIAGTGSICGGITGSLINFGLFISRDDLPSPPDMGQAMAMAKNFIASFEEKLGKRHCADIIETVTIGYKLNPGESDAAMQTFAKEKGFEKCSMVPGIGARLAAEHIIDSMK